MDKLKFEIMRHTLGHESCGGIAFLFQGSEPFAPMTVDRIKYPSGKVVVADDFIICDNCGMRLNEFKATGHVGQTI